MLQITEDTPPDMLAGAMDLTVHLPTGRSVKMSVERSTPMMDLLVQITTTHHLQLSGYTLQALGMAPSSEHGDAVLPYKPNTPIGALDTQHIKVVPKSRTIPVPKNVPPGHQPFESTFRLKVHLPRNQLFVTRVSQSVLLDDIMKKVCEEKILDPLKYEFRHPGNLDEVLDPKLTLSDYAITEIYLVQKGTTSLNQAFSTSDIMALRKEEERKQMHNKTGGGVFNLIFRRGKSSTGSLSSENRSISPTHSDDSRSVTPPGLQPPVLAPQQPEPSADKPKPPQRKRRPAPKPPQDRLPADTKKMDNGLTICHSRNSSDSSGYHEASILSDNCNTSLPRRPKSTIINEEKPLSDLHSQSTSNLSKMSVHSKSTSSLAFPNRKKKSAPPPPPVLKPATSESNNFQEPSPVVVASQPSVVAQDTQGRGPVINSTNPTPIPRTRTKIAPAPHPRRIALLKAEAAKRIEAVSQQSIDIASVPKETLSNVDGEGIHQLDEKRNLGLNKIEEHRLPENVESEGKTEETAKNIVLVTVEEHTNIVSESLEKPITTKQNVEDQKDSFSEYETEEDEEKPKHVISDKQVNKDIEEIKAKLIEEVLPIAGFKKTKDEVDSKNINEEKVIVEKAIHSDLLQESETIPTEQTVVQPTNSKEPREQPLNSEEPQVEVIKREEPRVEPLQPEAITSNSTETASNTITDMVPVMDPFEELRQKAFLLTQLQKQNIIAVINTTTVVTGPAVQRKEEKMEEKVKPPEVVAFYPKTPKKDIQSKSMFDSYSRKRGFQIGSSLLNQSTENDENPQKKTSNDLSSPNSVSSALNAFDFVDEIDGVDVELFSGSLSKNSKNKNLILNQLHGMHEFENLKKNQSAGSLRSVSSVPGFLGSNMKKWSNMEDLDDISLHSCPGQNGWVLGEPSDTESTASTSQLTPLDSLTTVPSLSPVESKPKEVETIIPINVESKNVEVNESMKENDLDWHYQLPSPPKAFRDSSPVGFTTRESVADSVVTSPELFEKLKVVKDTQSEKETASDITSVMSEDERPLLNKLSLENLEKRKSLVYNRELSTSLKVSDEDIRKDTFASSLTKFEKTYDEVKRSSPREVPMKSTLPNFKITTYDNPKQKLDIFEDDTVRSNSDSKRNSFAEPLSTLQKTLIGRSMENISFRKNSTSSDEEFGKKRNDYKFFRPPLPKNQLVFRSESFSKEQTWVPTKPVTRSKSQVALNKFKDTKNANQLDEDILTKSNSLFDVSGLQSLGVMRLIQNKLNTPNTSSEQLDKEEPTSYQQQPETKSEVQTMEKQSSPPAPPPPVKTYQYRVPSINMGTWSERPKVPVNLKEDPDYKFGVKDTHSSKLIVNTVNNDIKSHNSIEVRKVTPPTYNGVNFRVSPDSSNRNVSIKVNGSEPISGQNTGNVVIKIGGTSQTSNKPIFRKPLGIVNENGQRPHSIAFGGDFDISRVPIVRSVEFKKPYKDFQSSTTSNNNNTSVTQIYQNNNNFKTNTLNRNGFNGTEPLVNNMETPKSKPQVEPKPVFRVNSYLQNVSAPVVRGFRGSNEANRVSWSQPSSFTTLRSKTKEFTPNASVPFSQSNLRRTESTKVEKVPPPAPVMPKGVIKAPRENYEENPKEQLLQAIRDFGGKKGLRTVKA